MLRFTTGDVLAAETEAIVNTVNCVGVMGRGIALQFKRAFPENFAVYEAACQRGEVVPGRILVFETGQLAGPRYILNFPTKRHWRAKSRIEDIEAGLADLRRVLVDRGIRSVAVPPLGSGLGGLDWSAVRERVQASLGDLPDVDVVVYEPGGGPTDGRPNRSQPTVAMTPGRAALVSLVHRYLGGLMDPEVTLLEVHKLMYFMQVLGEPLRLRYVRGPYGPYAENLRHVLTAIEGHLLTGYADGGDAPGKALTLVPGAVDDARAFLDGTPETLERCDRVAALVEGFETPFGLELLATVHMVLAAAPDLDDDGLAAAVYGWNDRKRMFRREHLRIARDRLDDMLAVDASPP